MYIKDSFLNWNVDIQSWSEINPDEKKRSIELLFRAENHLNFNDDNDSRADAIVTLKRAINHRLKLIEKCYNLKKIDFPDKPKGYLELLESLGIVRPLLLKELMQIRNEIEHNDAKPPKMNVCRIYVDVVWYFLKSTNRMVTINSDDFIFTKMNGKNETQYWLNIYKRSDDFQKFKINGWLPKSHLKENTNLNEYFKIEINDIHSKEQRWNNSKEHSDKKSTDIWVNGILLIDENHRKKLLHMLLELEN